MLIGLGAIQNTAQKAALVQFQQGTRGALPMTPHGHPDPNTLINMGSYDPLEHWPKSQVNFLTTGDKPGTFGRDLAGVNNQVPRWAWFVMGGTFLVMSAMAYRRHRKEKKGGK